MKEGNIKAKSEMDKKEKNVVTIKTMTDELYDRLKQKATNCIEEEKGAAFGNYLEVQKIFQYKEIPEKNGVVTHQEKRLVALNLAIRNKREVYLEFDFVNPVDENQINAELSHILSWVRKICFGGIIIMEISPKRLSSQKSKNNAEIKSQRTSESKANSENAKNAGKANVKREIA